MKKRIMVEGMSCGHCVKHVKEALLELDGVKSADVSLDTKTAVIEFDGSVDDGKIKFAIEDAGYEVTGIVQE